MSPSVTQTNTSCPYCGRPNDIHRGRDGTAPGDGDMSLCWGCRQIGIFVVLPDTSLTIRKATDAEHTVINQLRQVRAARAAIAESYTPTQAAELWAKG